jgi:hypothetical protein
MSGDLGRACGPLNKFKKVPGFHGLTTLKKPVSAYDTGDFLKVFLY